MIENMENTENLDSKTEEQPASELDLLIKELADKNNSYLRTLADFDNFKKRTASEKEQFIRFANESLIAELLPIVDNFSRAIEAAEKAGASEEMIKGLCLVKRQIDDTLTKYGVKEVDALGKPFDPNFHEAIVQKEAKGEEGVILEEMQKGYTLYGKLIRPAMVIVSKKHNDK
ncbi:nucleotide exchange factor GrpE [Candidatus Saganbacteria bacterium CG08_land_8_20_14_0_20_45_16]|uniref:Protein GrpE n=1 Tax=Candidatus Saganbacteria bacterium CG08_land_8_20_14_0_20_45_16 TaxID=2014293 RepID=A0A2H0XX26_UNCSA|nr:MAG: nucleotide exchange factor GrpE [Candidatus Saganbacteria bacterium CG08_land_8_20_14_0_20_45_16]